MKKITFILITIALIACGESQKENQNDDNVEKAIKDGIEVLTNMDKLENELKSEKEKRNQHRLSGYFKGSISGNALNYDEWDPVNSRGSLFDQRAVFHFFINEENGETLTITLNGKDVHNGSMIKNYSATMIPYKPMDKDFMKKFNNGFANVSYTNDATNKKWSSADGDVVIEAVTANTLKVRWKGEAFQGKWQNQQLVPFEGEANLNFNFISDLRKL